MFKIDEKEADLLQNDNVGKTDFDVIDFGMESEEHLKKIKEMQEKAEADGEHFALLPN